MDRGDCVTQEGPEDREGNMSRKCCESSPSTLKAQCCLSSVAEVTGGDTTMKLSLMLMT